MFGERDPWNELITGVLFGHPKVEIVYKKPPGKFKRGCGCFFKLLIIIAIIIFIILLLKSCNVF